MIQRICIVEDDDHIRELIEYALKGSGFSTRSFSDGGGVIEYILSNSTDLVLLDIMLPVEDGMSLLEKIKGNSKLSEIPVILLTAKSTELDKVKGLDAGADDYVTKPFSVMELISRVKAVLRRSEKKEDNRNYLAFGDLVIDKEKRRVTLKSQEVYLTYKEFELLVYLADNKEKVLSRDQIINAVWSYDFIGESRTVDMHIKALRQKLPDFGQHIVTVRNVGYVFRFQE